MAIGNTLYQSPYSQDHKHKEGDTKMLSFLLSRIFTECDIATTKLSLKYYTEKRPTEKYADVCGVKAIFSIKEKTGENNAKIMILSHPDPYRVGTEYDKCLVKIEYAGVILSLAHEERQNLLNILSIPQDLIERYEKAEFIKGWRESDLDRHAEIIEFDISEPWRD